MWPFDKPTFRVVIIFIKHVPLLSRNWTENEHYKNVSDPKNSCLIFIILSVVICRLFETTRIRCDDNIESI